MAGLSTMGLDLTSLAVFAGALGVGVGLGLQGIIKDFASGISLVFERLVAVGDFVELPSAGRGVIHEIGPRATRIRTNDSTDIIVPNSVLVNDQVINWTLRNTNRRIRVPFVAAFGADKNKVREAVLKAAKAAPYTSPDDAVRRAQVWLVGYGDSAEVRAGGLADRRGRAPPGGDLRGLYLADRRRPARGRDRDPLSAARRPPARPVRRGGRGRPDQPQAGTRRPSPQAAKAVKPGSSNDAAADLEREDPDEMPKAVPPPVTPPAKT
jgi:small-conductance mechanosensitive channel